MASPKKRKKMSKSRILKGRDLPKNEFPTLKQLLAYYYYQKDSKNIQGNVFLVMAIDLVSIWKKSSIPTISVHSVKNKLERILNPIILDFRKHKDRILKDGIDATTAKNLAKCFNIAKCPCFINAKSFEYIISITNRPKCVCLDVDKIPNSKIDFFANQLFKHKIPKIDHKFIDSRTDAEVVEKTDLFAKKVQRKALREAQKESQIEKQKQFMAQNEFVQFSQSSTSSNSQNLVDPAAKDTS